MDDSRPIFLQIAEQVENDIIAGLVAEVSQVPSTNEFAAFYRINPATALKGVNLLVDAGVIYKKRGIGMFVVAGARERLMSRRRDEFLVEFVRPLIAEASKLGITPGQLSSMIETSMFHTDGAGTGPVDREGTK
ncbi:GntR family transcriptional regulator [Glaciihabitans sp. INWT7]|uniref:GntR family transcriptional regulator n=1 Tax=Glaciihabitans sp. INWT7 TaxID=2596912 RepID=UPI001627442E|nr:GntR family transcriptional regulator [Glaciihabitans sp. INWT7]QNE47524.1 GntR family transcriptional regulator [Glaciihabitans sp. INWT7]